MTIFSKADPPRQTDRIIPGRGPKRAGLGLAAALGVVAIAAGALAHGGATGIVKERMDGMSAMAEVMKSLAPMMKGKVGYDAAAVSVGARTLSEHSGEAISSKFPEGSGGMPSEAAEEIWTGWNDFEALARQLETYASALELAADKEEAALSGTAETGVNAEKSIQKLAQMPTRQLFGMIGKTCSACHKRFRVETE